MKTNSFICQVPLEPIYEELPNVLFSELSTFIYVICIHSLGYSTPKTLNNRDRCRIGQVPIFDGPLAKLGDGGTYSELFVACLRNFGVLCIGLYRLSLKLLMSDRIKLPKMR